MHMKKVAGFFERNQFAFQSIVFWFVALLNFGSNKFWWFATVAIGWTAVDRILAELRKLNQNNN